MRVFGGGGGGAGRDREHRDRSGERSERQASARDSAGDSSGGSGSIRGGSGGGSSGVEVGGIFAPVPKRPDRSASPALAASLVESSGVFMSTTKRRVDRTPSPCATTHRRASYPSHTRPWNFADFRGLGSRYGPRRQEVIGCGMCYFLYFVVFRKGFPTFVPRYQVHDYRSGVLYVDGVKGGKVVGDRSLER